MLRVPKGERTHWEQLWNQVDEQFLPVDQRRRLTRNGLRCGVLGTQMPDWIQHLIDRDPKHVVLDRETGTASIRGLSARGRMQCRAGKKRIVATVDRPTEVTIHASPDGEVSAQTYQQAQCQLALVPEPLGDGRVRLEITPEISHGRPRQRWVGENGRFRAELARDCREFPEARITATLGPGQTLLLTAIPGHGGVGEALFGEDPESGGQPRIWLVRLAQSQSDDLFAPERAPTPIATPDR